MNHFKCYLKPGVLAAVPVVLYAILAWQLSWRPRVLANERAPVTAVCFSPDGRQIASSADGGSVSLRDARTGTLLKTLRGHTTSIHAMAFSPDGATLAAAANAYTVRLWDTQSGKLKHLIHSHGQWNATLLDFSRDGQVLYLADSQCRIQLWNALSGKFIAKSPVLKWSGRGAAFSPDKKLFARRTDDGATVWSVSGGQPLMTVKNSKPYPGVLALSFSPDGRFLATVGGNANDGLWDLKTHRLAHMLPHPTDINLVTFSPDGQMLLGAMGTDGYSYSIVVWDVASATLTRTIPESGISCLTVSPDGTTMATGNLENHALKLWRVK